MIKFLITLLFFPLIALSQYSFIIDGGTKITSTNSPYINLYNTDLYNNTSDNNIGTGTIWGFTGNIPQTINGTYISNFYGLRLNNPNGFTLQSNTNISNRLDMVNGNITLGSYNLEIGTSSTNTGVLNWTNGTIIGPLKRWFAPSTNSTQGSGIFPIGNDGTNRYFTINYTQAPTSGGYIIGEYKSGIPVQTNNYAGLPFNSSDGQIIQNYADEGYFDITPDNYTGSLNSSQYTIKMRGVNLMTVNDYSTVRLVKNPGPSHTGWVPCGSHSSVSGTNSDFTITSTNVVGFSWFNFGGNDNNPLPVELLYFEGTPYPTFNVLRWTTASEHNSSYFDLESSTNGAVWETIAKIPSVGNSMTKINYSYIDNTIDEVLYYRLLQYDIDGNFKTYEPITIIKPIKGKKLIKYINLLGQEVKLDNTSGILIEVYDDGTIRRIFR